MFSLFLRSFSAMNPNNSIRVIIIEDGESGYNPRLCSSKKNEGVFEAYGLVKQGVALMPTGRVKWFNDHKGFGFITNDDGGEDLFVHHTSIAAEGFRTLHEDQAVEFEIGQGQKGPQAIKVKPI